MEGNGDKVIGMRPPNDEVSLENKSSLYKKDQKLFDTFNQTMESK